MKITAVSKMSPEARAAILALQAKITALKEGLEGALHEADWMIEAVKINRASYSGVKARLKRHRALLTQHKDTALVRVAQRIVERCEAGLTVNLDLLNELKAALPDQHKDGE